MSIVKKILEDKKDWEQYEMGKEWWICMAIVIFAVVVLLCLFGWLGWYIWWMNTHHCLVWTQPYWSTDHYGKPVITRDCSEWSK